jgi:S-DNA-T family DNA segregation ATPase FtsK/SpoIIIE
VLGQGWAAEGYTAADIDPLARGVGWLLSETGTPRRIKAAYLDDDTIKYLADYAAQGTRQAGRRMSAVHALNGHATTSHPGRS